MKIFQVIAVLTAAGSAVAAPEKVDEMWLRFRLVSNATALKEYRGVFESSVAVEADAATLAQPGEVAQLETAATELAAGLSALLGRNVTASCCAAQPMPSPGAGEGGLHVSVAGSAVDALGAEGFRLLQPAAPVGGVALEAASASGALYGAFRLMQRLQLGEPLPRAGALPWVVKPAMTLRMWDLWDDNDGTVTARCSLWSRPRC